MLNAKTGCPSIDKPWMKFYPDEAGDALVSEKSMHQLFKKVEMSGQIAVVYTALPRFWGVLQIKADGKA